MRNARSVRVLQHRHAPVSHLNRDSGNQVGQGARATGEVQQAVRASIVIVPIRIILVIGAMVVVMRIGSKLCVLGSMQLAKLGQHRRDHQSKHQQRQKAGVQGS